jgi:hypothetical protein
MKQFILPALVAALWPSTVTAEEKPDLKKQLAGTWEMKSLFIGGKNQNPDPVS